MAAAALLAVAGFMVLLVGTSRGAPAPNDPADLAVTKSDSPDPVSVGATLTYSIQVANAGPDAATNVVLSDRLPKGVSFLSASASQGSCSNNKLQVTCLLGTIGFAVPNYSPASVVIRVTAPQTTGTITNTASVASDATDPNTSNNKASATTRVVKAPGPNKGKGPKGKGPKGNGSTCAGRVATQVGTPGPDVLTGTGRTDVILALAGNDRISTLGGSDLVCAGRGNDVVKSGSRSDKVFAGPGADRVKGGAASDRMRGGRGPDRLRGGRGNDLLAGGRGDDLCIGGPGRDVFRSC